MSKDELPSINDYLKESDLPSYKDFMEKKKELPSVEDYITETNQNYIQEETQTIEDVNGESFLEVSDIVNAPEWSELVRLVNDVRKDIPEIPEIKYYDSELSEICEKIIEIQENLSRFDVKSDKIHELNEKNEEFEVKLSEIESKIPQVPEIKYYDSDIESIYEKIQQISEGIDNLPEIKHYDAELKSLSAELKKVRDRDVPDFRWIGNTFNSIDEDFEKVQGHLSLIRDKIESEVSQLTETIQVKDFEQNITVNNLSENLNESIEKTNTKLEETKDKIYSELSQSSLRIWEYHREFKDDDRKLKKSILSEQNKLKQSLQKEIEEFNEQSVKTDEKLLKFFNDLKVEVSLLPEVKYYDEDISTLKDEIDSLRDGLKDLNKIASLIKRDQKELKENYLLSEPPEEKQKAGGQSDPLTPTGEKFATFKDLESHYRLFLNRIQVQLSTIGGGGAGFIKDLDDVSFDESSGDGKLLIYDQANSKWVGIASTALGSGGSVGAAGTWAATSAGIHTTKNVGIATTARTDYALYVEGDQYIDGNITVGGTITYDDVKNVDSIGVITARTGVDVLAGGINVTGVSTFNSNVNFNGNINGNVTIVSTDGGSSAAPELTLYRNSASPAPGDYLGQLMFKGENSNGGEENYAKITGKITDETLGTEDGIIETAVKGAGSFTIVSRQRSDELQLLNNVGLSVDGTSTFEDNVTINANISHTGTAVFGSSNGIGTVHVGLGNTALLVDGNARITGILTIGQGSITLDPNARKIEGIDQIIIGSATTITIKQDSEGSIEFTDSDGEQQSVGIGTTVSINTTGIITAATLKASTAFYPPIYTTTDRDAGTFNEGAMIYNSSTKKLEFYDGTNWNSVPGVTLGLTIALDG